MKLSIIVPCYNEEPTIQELIRRVSALDTDKEIILVDDGSTDGTRKILSQLNSSTLKIARHEMNIGKGAAIRTGLQLATGDVIVVQDADLEYDPQEILELVEPIRQDVADVVYGSRFAGGRPHRVMFFWHYLGNKIITTLVNLFTNLNLTDVETCYKAFRKGILERITIEEKRFGFEVEVTCKIAQLRCRIYERGISYYGRTYEEGKKIGWKDGIYAIVCVLKYGLRSG